MNLAFIGIASIVFAAAIAAIVVARLRAQHGLLFWIGIFAFMYAVRLFLENPLIRAASEGRMESFQLAVRFLTYLIAIPYALFTREYFGSGWKKSILVWLWAEVAFAPLAIAAAFFNWQAGTAFFVNNSLVIFGTLLVALHLLLRHGAALGAPKTAILVACAVVILNNLGFRPAGINIEPLGFLMLLCALGYTASEQAIAKERKLSEVEYQLGMARLIQSSILPSGPPKLRSLQLATRYQPMTEVAGDFYDFLQPREDTLTILVADVSGHGVAAALVASMLKVGFAFQSEHASDPAKILAGLNSMLRPILGGLNTLRPILSGQYVTAACAAIDLSAKVVTYAGAGHPPALLLRNHTGQVAQLAENGLFIGPFPNATYTSISVPFDSGDKLLLYTDGIIEAVISGDEQFGKEGLANFLLNSRNLRPADFIDGLFRKITNGAQQDDLTAVFAEFD